MLLKTERATVNDLYELYSLYMSIYGDDYPLPLGTNQKVMKNALSNPDKFLWNVTRDCAKAGIIVGSAIIEVDLEYKIGKLAGVVVHPDYRENKIAYNLIQTGIQEALCESGVVNSIYTTTRTLDVAPQRMCLKNGFIPLGIFPNARKIKSYETLTLMGIFKEGVLQNRNPLEKVHESMLPIVKIIDRLTGSDLEHGKVLSGVGPTLLKDISEEEYIEDIHGFELIYAPEFVKRKFNKAFLNDRESAFYPFHDPNLLITSNLGELEIYASFNKKDHYCVLMTANTSISSLSKMRFKKMIFALKEMGIYYLETLVRMDYFDALSYLIGNRFLPSAVYPAMREENGKMHDYVLLTRTMVPLDFSEIKIDQSFMPFIKQYASLWVCQHLDGFEVK